MVLQGAGWQSASQSRTTGARLLRLQQTVTSVRHVLHVLHVRHEQVLMRGGWGWMASRHPRHIGREQLAGRENCSHASWMIS
jgi:hypothetical protein